MRYLSHLIAPTLVGAVLFVAGPAAAQVTVDLRALDALPAVSASPRPVPRPAPSMEVRPRPLPAPMAASVAASVPVPAPVPSSPVPSVPAATAILTVPPPQAIEPPSPPLPAVPVVVVARPAQANIRIAFAADQSELSSDGVAAVKTLAAAAGNATAFNVVSYADGIAEDPSSARRLSLQRAHAVRSVLIGMGIPSSRITMRALGNRVGEGPPDRVDINTIER